MGFIKQNKWVILFTFIILLLKVLELPILGNYDKIILITKDYNYTLTDCLFYITSNLGKLNLLPAIYLFYNTKTKEGKIICFGLILYNIYEVAQDLNLLLNWRIIVLNKGFLLAEYNQIIFINLLIISVYTLHKKGLIQHI